MRRYSTSLTSREEELKRGDIRTVPLARDEDQGWNAYSLGLGRSSGAVASNSLGASYKVTHVCPTAKP